MIDSGNDAGHHQPPLNIPPTGVPPLGISGPRIPGAVIATIYSLVTMQGAKYRDFSASRQQIRSRFRQRLLLKQRVEAARKAREQTPPAQHAAPGSPAGESEARQARNREEISESAFAPPEEAAPLPAQEPATEHARDIEDETLPLPATGPSDREEKAVPQAGLDLSGTDFPGADLEGSAGHEGAFSHKQERALSQDDGEVPQPDSGLDEPGAPFVNPFSAEPAGGDAPPEAEALRHGKAGSGSRWFALRSVRAGDAETRTGARTPRQAIPALAIFSQAGGVGKTSLAATVGRLLAARGEQAFLAETASPGLLPVFFGSREVKSGVVRTFSPPAEHEDAAVRAVALDPQQFLEKRDAPDPLAEALLNYARGSSRILIDIQTGSRAIARRLLPLVSIVLVPLLADMSSVMSLDAVEAVFAGRGEANKREPGGHAIEPVYLLNQFDGTLPLQVEVRGLLEERLGPRLLPFVVRRSAAVSEALAEGMTVVDYAPGSSVAEDYVHLARWLAGAAPVPASGLSGLRWTER